MRHIYFFFIVFIFFSVAQAQVVTIPDTDFRDLLLDPSANGALIRDLNNSIITNVDTNNDGQFQVTEVEQVSYIYLGYSGTSPSIISSLEGINNFVNINKLIVGKTNIATLNINLQALTWLSIKNNDLLSSMDILGCTNLENLYIEDNEMLTALDVSGLANLYTLECIGSYLYNAPRISSINVTGCTGLYSLDVNQNNLTNIDVSTCTSLSILKCGRNLLTTLDVSGCPVLRRLHIYHNDITAIDLSTAYELFEFDCSNTLIESINVSNCSKLNTLNCHTNDALISLFIKNGKVEGSLGISSTPNLAYICCDLDQLSYIQNSALYQHPNTVANTYCSFNPGGEYFVIEGENKLDSNSNGCDVSDLNYPNFKFNVTDGSNSGVIIADETGAYSFPVEDGSHTLTPIVENPTYYSVTPPSITIDFPSETSPYNQDFCVTPNGVFNDLEVVVVPLELARPGFDTDYKLIYKNKGTSILSGNIMLTFLDDVMNLVSANPSVDSQIQSQLTWNYVDLAPFETREIDFTMNLNTPTDANFPLNGDDVLVFDATVNPTVSDETPDDNVFVLNQTVVNSYDPNDKTCLEGEIITESMIGKYVHYTIRFENTGTANAINVVVKDVIDVSKFDVSSLIPLSSSHNFVTRIRNTNEVEFIFENIQLPFDDANNDGYIMFKIETLPTLSVGDTFANEAEIYFDFNAPIITNDYLTTIENNLSIGENVLPESLNVYPNPVKDKLYIESQEPIVSATIYDINGRLLQTITLIGNQSLQSIDVKQLSKGVYFVSLKSTKGEHLQKIVKQ